MAKGRSKAMWQHTASVLAMIHNVNCTKKTDCKPPSAFDPHTPKAKRFVPQDGFAILRSVMVPNSLKS